MAEKYWRKVACRAWADAWAVTIERSPSALFRDFLILVFTGAALFFLQPALEAHGILPFGDTLLLETIIWSVFGVIVIAVIFALVFVSQALFLVPARLYAEKEQEVENLKQQMGLKLKDEPDYDAYDKVETFSLLMAAFLWVGEEQRKGHFPKVQIALRRLMETIEKYGGSLKERNEAFFRASLDVALSGGTKAISERTIATRSSLIELAGLMGDRPPFLFPEERTNAKVSDPEKLTRSQQLR